MLLWCPAELPFVFRLHTSSFNYFSPVLCFAVLCRRSSAREALSYHVVLFPTVEHTVVIGWETTRVSGQTCTSPFQVSKLCHIALTLLHASWRVRPQLDNYHCFMCIGWVVGSWVLSDELKFFYAQHVKSSMSSTARIREYEKWSQTEAEQALKKIWNCVVILSTLCLVFALILPSVSLCLVGILNFNMFGVPLVSSFIDVSMPSSTCHCLRSNCIVACLASTSTAKLWPIGHRCIQEWSLCPALFSICPDQWPALQCIARVGTSAGCFVT